MSARAVMLSMPVRDAWEEFVRWEKASGGPDPHVTIAANMARGHGNPAWLCGLFAATYTTPGMEALADEWNPSEVLAHPFEVEGWCVRHWAGIPIRKERKTNGVGPIKLAQIVLRYARWVLNGNFGEVYSAPDFDSAFHALTESTWGFGHYFGLKLYETMRRAGCPLPWPVSDIRPKGGAFARRGLALLYPQHDPKDDSVAGQHEANAIAEMEMALLREKGLHVSWYEIEVLFCNFRQAVNGGQYPGRAHDSELGHVKVYEDYWKRGSEVRRWRRELFPPLHMGELGGWEGRRPLAACMNHHGYVWSDLVYDWAHTGPERLAQPRRWSDGPDEEGGGGSPLGRLDEADEVAPKKGMKVHEVLRGRESGARIAIRGWPGLKHLQAIRDGGWRVLCVCPRSDEGLARALGSELYQHVPLSDGLLTGDNMANVERAVRLLVSAHEWGCDVLVHCHAGRNRSALVAALAYRQLQKVSGAEALEHLRRVRPRALANPHFEEYLNSLPAPE